MCHFVVPNVNVGLSLECTHSNPTIFGQFENSFTIIIFFCLFGWSALQKLEISLHNATQIHKFLQKIPFFLQSQRKMAISLTSSGPESLSDVSDATLFFGMVQQQIYSATDNKMNNNNKNYSDFTICYSKYYFQQSIIFPSTKFDVCIPLSGQRIFSIQNNSIVVTHSAVARLLWVRITLLLYHAIDTCVK